MTMPDRAPVLASVIVAMNPHDHDFASVLDAWAAQSAAGDYEVVVAHDGCRASLPSEFATHKLRHPSTPVRLVGSVATGRAASNNAGVRASRGGLLLFVADDFRPTPGLVAAHRAFHETIGRPAVGIGPGYFSGSTRADPFVRWLEDSGNIWGVSFATGRMRWREDFFYVGNASMPRTVFDAVGRFDETFRHDLFDDWEFGRRLFATGVTAHFVPRAIAWHDHELTLEERLVAVRRVGECAAVYERELPERLQWAIAGSIPLRDLEEAVRDAGQRAARSGSFADRREMWLAHLGLAFARGYQAASAGGSASRHAG